MTTDCELTDRGLELGDGGLIEWPECDGTIRRLDREGDCEEIRQPGDEGYGEWLTLFPIERVEIEYTVTFRRTLNLPTGRQDLVHLLSELVVPEDDCTQYVPGTFQLQRVVRNGRDEPVPAVVHL